MRPEPSIRFGAEDSIEKKITTISFWALFPLLILASFFANQFVPPSSEFEIKEMAKKPEDRLTRDLDHARPPENARIGHGIALIAKFQQLTGITVQTRQAGNDTTAVLASYLRDFEPDPATLTCMRLILSGREFFPSSRRLRPTIGPCTTMLPTLVQTTR